MDLFSSRFGLFNTKFSEFIFHNEVHLNKISESAISVMKDSLHCTAENANLNIVYPAMEYSTQR